MISIIGAGPAGNYLAYLLSKSGHKAEVYEEHPKIGRPIQCTGITTFFLNDIVKVKDEFLINTINMTKVYSPDGSFVEIPLKDNYIVDREKFDAYFGEIAQSNGVNYILGKRLIDCKVDGKIKLKFKNFEKETDLLIGADGPMSQVARSTGIYGKRKFVVGHQARIELDNECEENVVEFFLDKDYIGWLVPEDKKIVRLGIASYNNAGTYFNKLLNKRNGKILEWQSGPIPIYDPKVKTEFKNKVFLVGDAATMVKATTYGGIIPGLMAGQELSKAINTGKNYRRLWKKRIGKELYLHLLMRKVMNKFNEENYNYLIKLTQKEKIKNLINENDREFPSKLIFKMALVEPRFLKFSRFLLRL